MRLNLYEIRYCKKDEYDKLIDFLSKYWKGDHIFCKSKEIFEFQHGKAENGYYDFVVAVHKETQEFHAVLGFIRSSRYDGRVFDNPQAVYGALWKVRDDVHNSEIGKLGLGVLYYLIKSFPHAAYVTLGLSKYSQAIYQALHFEFAAMKHYYIPNINQKQNKIIQNPEYRENVRINENISLRKLQEPQDLDNSFFPDKTPEYIRNRYLRHPVYKYELLGIYREDRIVCEWITRKICVGHANGIRIVDMVGTLEKIGDIYQNVNAYLQEEKAEYIDCYNYGLPSEQFYHMGFVEKKVDTVVPNYFEPFERRNVDIYCAINGKQDIIVFKGDGDQDRPNVL